MSLPPLTSLQGPSLFHPQAMKAQDCLITTQSTIAGIQHPVWSLGRSPAKLSVEKPLRKLQDCLTLARTVCLLHNKRANSPGTPLIATTNGAGWERSSRPGKGQAAAAFGELMSDYPWRLGKWLGKPALPAIVPGGQGSVCAGCCWFSPICPFFGCH